MRFQQNFNNRQSLQVSSPFESLLNLALKARAEQDPVVLRSLLALIYSNDVSIVKGLVMRLRSAAIIEQLDPYPFARPKEKDFL